MRAGIDFIVPDDYCHIPDSKLVKAGYFVMTDPKLFPDGIVRKRVMDTEGRIRNMLVDMVSQDVSLKKFSINRNTLFPIK